MNEATKPFPDDTRGHLTRTQVERLMKAIDPNHVETKQGLSYIAQHQARAEMTRIFGPGNWDSKLIKSERYYENSEPGTGGNSSKTYWITGWYAEIEVNIRDYWGRPIATFIEAHFEENVKLPNRGEANAMALTSVQSYALRRALIGLGDRLGLGLYDKGSLAPLVVGTLQLTDKESPLYIEKPTAEDGGTTQTSGRAAAHQQAFAQDNPEG